VCVCQSYKHEFAKMLRAFVLCLQKELIREVEMGPFKHTVDDGLDIRKVHNLSTFLS